MIYSVRNDTTVYSLGGYYKYQSHKCKSKYFIFVLKHRPRPSTNITD